jgi:centromere protein V
LAKHSGGCHCERIRFEVETPAEIEAVECNCSICAKSGFVHLIVPKDKFTLIQGSQYLSAYRFNTRVAEHLFCRVCGIKSFYVPRSNPDGYSVNLRCLDPGTIGNLVIKTFDGRHWEKSAGELAHFSKD